MCHAKNRYPNELTARAAGMHYIGRGDANALWIYQCPYCSGFHLTRKDHGKRRNVMDGMPPLAAQTEVRDVK